MTPSLLNLPVLVVDCQTTGGSPRTGHLLDLGWCVTRAAETPVSPDRVRHHLVRLPRGATVPRPVSQLTGITTAQTRKGQNRDQLWRGFQETVDSLRNGDAEDPFCVAHYARFEEGFLRALHAECAPATPFPLRFLCTHEICRRLFPGLPRRGLNAVSGLLGAATPELKRAQGQVAATTGVWIGLVRRLADEHGVHTLDDLRAFLRDPAPRRGGRWEYPLPRETRLALPDRPGVYRFLGGDGTVLYVGKARSLRTRVNSYYRKRRAEDKVLELVSQARDVEVTVTGSSLEAALLEASEIQRLAPRYNHALRVDDPRVWFFSPDFASARSRRDRRHRRGPMPDRRPFAILRALSMLLRGELPRDQAESALARALELPGLGRGSGVLAAGVELVVERNALDPATCRPGMLLYLGRRLARTRRTAQADADADGGGEEGGSAGESLLVGLFDPEHATRRRGPTPEGVAEWLESTLVTASRLASRARWFSVLAGSTLSWRIAGDDAVHPTPRPRRVLMLKQGSISLINNALPGETPPLAPDCSRRTSLAGIDRAGYDRLRVLTSEIKRLLAEGREVELHLDPKRRLGTRRLRRILEGV